VSAGAFDLSVILGRHLFQSLIGFRSDKKDIVKHGREEGKKVQLSVGSDKYRELTSLE
jgi:hypothetical protein